MNVQSVYPIITTPHLKQCREFYTRWLGFDVVFEASWFVYLSAPGNPALGVAFMTPDHPSRPPGPEKFDGKGVLLTVQVDDAGAQFERLRKAGAPISYALKDEAWGQRRFCLVDPSGTLVDVVQQIEPAPGFWDEYMR